MGLVLLSAVLAACAIPGTRGKERVTPIAGKRVDVTVTTDGGSRLLVRRDIPLTRGMTALDAVRQVADVRMGPGNVVMQINGKGGGRLRAFGPEQAGWMYRINGIEAETDPARFRLKPGSSVWWDLRRHDIYERVPVAIGVFPEPWISGWRHVRRRVQITHGRVFRRDAELLAEEVFASSTPEIRSFREAGRFAGGVPGGEDADDLPVPTEAVRAKRSNIVIGRWEEARMDPWIADIGMDPRRFGLTTWIEGTEVRRQGVQEEFSRELERAEGVVWATTIDGEPDGALVLVVTGTTDQGVRQALRALRSGAFQFSLSGAVTADGDVVR